MGIINVKDLKNLSMISKMYFLFVTRWRWFFIM